ncbi:hypothetical protein A3Q56_05201 [Intoshia linei]|uniref:Dipeptidylpeptidase IV N-terminal domain-containing protein n=1 Tax=Intoshia linei TaxID=1819745 RepID=A0A177AYG1_9BILA|nr:hypothetical protein A3Q56_05201 [Intoshia linei]
MAENFPRNFLFENIGEKCYYICKNENIACIKYLHLIDLQNLRIKDEKILISWEDAKSRVNEKFNINHSPNDGIFNELMDQRMRKYNTTNIRNMVKSYDDAYIGFEVFPNYIYITNVLNSKWQVFSNKEEGLLTRPLFCTFNSNIMAFVTVGAKDVFIGNFETGELVKILSVDDPNLFIGCPSYIIMEEFNRFDGCWWIDYGNCQDYYLLVEYINNKKVENVKLHCKDNIIDIPYSCAGSANASSIIKLIHFKKNDESISVMYIILHYG